MVVGNSTFHVPDFNVGGALGRRHHAHRSRDYVPPVAALRPLPGLEIPNRGTWNLELGTWNAASDSEWTEIWAQKKGRSSLI